MNEIKYAYPIDGNGSIVPLPASPLLLPVLGLYCLAPLLAQMVEEAERSPRPLSNKFDPIQFSKNQAIYHELTDKKRSGIPLTYQESLQLQSIMNPPWAEPGEVWSY